MWATAPAITRPFLQGGWVGDAAGFRIHLSNNVPESAGSYSVIAGTNAAGPFAEQLVELEAYRLEKNFSDGLKGCTSTARRSLSPTAWPCWKCTKAAA